MNVLPFSHQERLLPIEWGLCVCLVLCQAALTCYMFIVTLMTMIEPTWSAGLTHTCDCFSFSLIVLSTGHAKSICRGQSIKEKYLQVPEVQNRIAGTCMTWWLAGNGEAVQGHNIKHCGGISNLWQQTVYMLAINVPLIDWISDTCPQGCIDLHSPVKCLDHRCCGRYSMQSCKAINVVYCAAGGTT